MAHEATVPFAGSTLSHAILLEAGRAAGLQVQEGEGHRAAGQNTDSTVSRPLPRLKKRKMNRVLRRFARSLHTQPKILDAYRKPGLCSSTSPL